MASLKPMKIYYDGECPLCKKEMFFLKKRDRSNLLELVDISSPYFNPITLGKTKDQLMARIHGMLNENNLIEGVEVFRQAYSRVGLGWLLWITKIPVFKQIADLFYVLFAKYRIRIGNLFGRCDSGSCNLK